MHGAAVKLAEEFLAQSEQPDLLLTTDMLDTATFLALTRIRTAGLPIVVYFHENQLTYPWSPTDEDPNLKRDRHYAWLNYTSALAADVVLFNSDYHRQGFLTALLPFLKAFPDYRGIPTIAQIEKKSQTLYLGMSLASEGAPAPKSFPGSPVLLWNHRWEYDKNPELFFRICQRLQAENLPFRLVVLGEQYAQAPVIFTHARPALADRILHWGYAKTRTEYLHWVQQADLLPVTSHQDFFGGSIVEAIYHGVYPLLPNRLAYPEHLPAAYRDRHLYENEAELLTKLRTLLQSPRKIPHAPFRSWVAHYDWSKQASVYDDKLEEVQAAVK
jgi:glycosyltransferase involved in cell wall biosynthesis